MFQEGIDIKSAMSFQNSQWVSDKAFQAGPNISCMLPVTTTNEARAPMQTLPFVGCEDTPERISDMKNPG